MPGTTAFWRDPALPHVESRRACHSRACYKPHSHPTFSIGAVDAGGSIFTGSKDGKVALGIGSLVLVPAGCVHACNPLPGALWSYQMLHLDARWLQAHAPALDGDTATVLHCPLLYAQFCAMNALLFSTAGAAEKNAALLAFLGACASARADLLPSERKPRAAAAGARARNAAGAALGQPAATGASGRPEPLSIDPRLSRRHGHDAACLPAEPEREPRAQPLAGRDGFGATGA